MRILLLEDDGNIARAVASDLTSQGHAVRHLDTVAAARKALSEESFDFLIFDVNLPDGKCFDLCREVQAEKPGLPVLVLTANSDEQTALRSLSLGAVDFVRKPFSRAELLLRIKRHSRDRTGTVTFGELSLNRDAWKAEYAGREVAATRKELEILAVLLRHPDDLVSRETILQAVDPDGQMAGRTLNSHMSRLRRKIEEAAGGQMTIEATYGVGYRLLQNRLKRAG